MTKEGKISELFCHNIERFPQPIPTKSDGGDCFACAMLAALRWLYPERSLTFDEVWDTYVLTQENEDGTSFEYMGNSWGSYPKVLENAKQKLSLNDFRWRQNQCYPTFTSWGNDAANWNRDNSQYGLYWEKMKDDLHNGGVIFISINMDGEGPWKNGRWNETDHVVLVDGVRRNTVPLNIPSIPGAARIEWEVHVICSRDKGGWKTIHEFLDLHGAGSWHVLERHG